MRAVSRGALTILLVLASFSISSSAFAQSFDGCGTIYQGFECMVFVADNGDNFDIRNFTPFGHEDYVHVVGTIDPACATFCFIPCLEVDMIEACVPGPEFKRGDVNTDGSYDIGDAIGLLNILFIFPTMLPNCADAADANDDGAINIADVVFILNDQFVSGSPDLPPPFTECGGDPTDDTLDCEFFPDCP